MRIASVGPLRHIPSNSRLGDSASRRAAVFLDRDGVLIEDVHYLADPKFLRLMPDTAQAIRLLQEKYLVIVATNQSAIARGLLDEPGLLTVHQHLANQLTAQGAVIDAFYFCPHLPNAPVDAYNQLCVCRKPAPGMILQAAEDWSIGLSESYMVGDSQRDIQAGRTAGVRTIMVGKGTAEGSHPEWLADDLVGAAGVILANSIRGRPVTSE